MVRPRGKVIALTVAGFGAAYGVLYLLRAAAAAYPLQDGLREALAAYVMALVAVTFGYPLGAALRIVAHARADAGHRDMLAPARRWVASHPVWTRAIFAFPFAALAVILATLGREGSVTPLGLAIGVPSVALLLELSGVRRAGLRALLAPSVSVADPPRDVGAGDAFTFGAVAVTLEARAAVVAMAALPVAFVLWATNADWSDGVAAAMMAGYLAVAVGGALLYQRASRIKIGLDGVLVTGTSDTRFFAYKDLDDARGVRGEVELVQRGRAVLRLQLHGEDAARRPAVLARIKAAIARARHERGDATTGFVSSASSAELARAAEGAGDYREAALSREQLWALVEGPAIDGDVRAATALALITRKGAEERARLRVAASHCADPKIRVVLEKIADEGEEGEVGEASPARRARAT